MAAKRFKSQPIKGVRGQSAIVDTETGEVRWQGPTKDAAAEVRRMGAVQREYDREAETATRVKRDFGGDDGGTRARTVDAANARVLREAGSAGTHNAAAIDADNRRMLADETEGEREDRLSGHTRGGGARRAEIRARDLTVADYEKGGIAATTGGRASGSQRKASESEWRRKVRERMVGK
jgi:hypothetical protein